MAHGLRPGQIKGMRTANIRVEGRNLTLTESAQRRLAERVRALLEEARLPVERAVLSVFEDERCALSCQLEVEVSARLGITVREAAPFLNPAVDAACLDALDTVARLERWLVVAGAAAAGGIEEPVSGEVGPDLDTGAAGRTSVR